MSSTDCFLNCILIRSWILFFYKQPLFPFSILPSRMGRFFLKKTQYLQPIMKTWSSISISISDLCSIFLTESPQKGMPKHRVPLNKEILRARVSYIEDSLRSLERFKGTSFQEFQVPDQLHIKISLGSLRSTRSSLLPLPITN